MTDHSTKLAYTINEAIAAIGIGRTKLYELAKMGKIEMRSLGGKTVIPVDSLRRVINDAPRADRPSPRPR